MRASEANEFREFVSVRLPGLRRSAYLLCGDPHAAEDVVSATLTKVFRHWRRIKRLEHPDAYLRRMLVTTYLDERRRPWRQEQPTDAVPDRPAGADVDVVDRVTLLALLDRLPPRQRAVLVLRFFDDLSVEQTADTLGCAAGTVKAHTHQGLIALRGMLGSQLTANKEE
jgi:RNA polymerase sigma-70 factor (sigma-E family)